MATRQDLIRYYSPALANPTAQPAYYTNLPQKTPEPQGIGIGRAAFGAAAIAGFGFIPFRGGRVWDKYISAIRHVEEYSPGQVLRTFQTSNILSVFGTQPSSFVSGQYLTQQPQYATYLTSLIGETPGKGVYGRLLSEGVTFRSGRLYWGATNEVALKHAQIISTLPGASSRVGAAYATSLGTRRIGDPLHRFFATESPIVGGVHTQIIGGQTRAQALYRKTSALGTELIGRFNRLLELPFEIGPVKPLYEKFTKATGFSLAVKDSGGMEMLGRLIGKYGFGLPAAYIGYQTLDYMARQSEILDKTAFSEGITAGIATAGVKANLAISKVADTFGLHGYRELQEEIAPKSTNITTLAGFPIAAAMGAATLMYGAKAARMLQFQYQGMNLTEARVAAEELFSKWPESGFLSRVGNFLNRPGKLLNRIGSISPYKAGVFGAAGLALAAISPFIPGALIPGKRPEELEALYTGEQLEPLHKGRFWLFGRGSFEGERIRTFKEHWYPSLLRRSRERSIWREDVTGEEFSPIEKFFKKEFTYYLEDLHGRERPYPVSGRALSEVPLIGPVLAATLGRFIKPPRYQFEEEWRSEGKQRLPVPGFGERVATEIGEVPGGVAVSRSRLDQVVGDQAYAAAEIVGLPGFTFGSIKKAITGREEFFDQLDRLATSERIGSFERKYWEMEIGDPGFTEAFRRLFPHRRRQIEEVNPIRNLLADWLPGPGEKGPNLLFGDPFSAIPYGETRIPGAGYESKYPELRGLGAENYPLIHRYAILSDLGRFTEKFKQTRTAIRKARHSDDWGNYEEKIYQRVEQQLKDQRASRTQFAEYKYLSPTGSLFGSAAEESSSALAAYNEMKKAGTEQPGIIEKTFGSYWELLSHNAELATENLTPFAPAAKFIHARSAVEQYEKERAYGTKSAFWDRPWENFLRPFVNMTTKNMGNTDIPKHVQTKREIESYFDVLKYVKNTRLANMAREAKDYKAAKEFEQKKDETLFGINPYTMNFSSLYRSLPREERDYFKEFSGAEDPEEQKRILNLVPENEQALYAARWKLANAQKLRKAKKAEILNEDQLEEANQYIDDVYEEARTEGFPSNKELMAEFFATRLPDENYADWYRRTKLLPEISNLPGPDWVGYSGSVQLEDLKLKLIQEMGANPFEYNLWPSRAKRLPYKPYIDKQAIEPLLQEQEVPREEIRSRINQLLANNEIRGSVFITPSKDREININTQQDMDLTPLYEEIKG